MSEVTHSDSLWPHGWYSLPGSAVLRIFQARVLEWVAISFSRRSSQPRDQTQVSHIVGRRLTMWATREEHWGDTKLWFWNMHLETSPHSLFCEMTLKPGLIFSPNQSLGGPRKQTRAIFWCGDPTLRYFSENQVFPFSSNLYVYDDLWSKGVHYCSVAQSCPTLFDSMNCSPPGSSVHWIFQARILEWVTISFSRGSSWL